MKMLDVNIYYFYVISLDRIILLINLIVVIFVIQYISKFMHSTHYPIMNASDQKFNVIHWTY